MLKEYSPEFDIGDIVVFEIRSKKYKGEITSFVAYDKHLDIQPYRIRSGPSYFIRNEDQIEFFIEEKASS